MPLRRDVRFTCTSPHNDNWDDYACKHVVATMFTLSDEFLLEPELLDLWRGHAVDGPGGDGAGEDRDDGDQYDGPGGDGAGEDRDDGGRRRGHLRLVGDRERAERPAPRVDPLAELLRFPEGTELPDVGEIDRIEPQLPRSRELAGVLRDAIGNLRIEWD
jgi:hypothetical protein